jgi:probable HAF family extracellular repeat protein
MKPFALFVVVLWCAVSVFAQDYKTVVVYKESGLRSNGSQMNNSGQVTGSFTSPSGNFHLFVWSKATGLQDLSTLGGSTSFNSAINDAGQISGQSDLPGDNATDAILWSKKLGMQDLGNLGGYFSNAGGVNSAGQVAGYSYIPGNQTTHAFFWTPADGMQDIGAGDGSAAGAINSNGQILGGVQDSPNHSYAFLWSKAGGFQLLIPPDSTYVYPLGLNDNGQVVGNYLSPQCQTELGCAFIWTPTGGFQFPTVNGSPIGAISQNATGAVLGYVPYPGYRAVLWTASGGGQDLGVLAGKTWSFPYSLNNKNEVLGVSCLSDGTHCKSFVWRPAQGLRAIPHTNTFKVFTQLNDAGQILGIVNYNETVLLSPWVHVKLASSQNPSKNGQNVTFTATVSSVEGAPKDGELMTFKAGKTVLGTAPLNAGAASVTTSSLVVGRHAITAIYGGDLNYDRSKSAAVQQVVTP